MTVAPPNSSNPTSNTITICQKSQPGPTAMMRRSSLQEGISNHSSRTARRSSLSSISKVKVSSQRALTSIIIVAEKDTSNLLDQSHHSTGSESFLQSTDKRRRYMRRGSKTSFMMRGAGNAFKVEFPFAWQTSLTKSVMVSKSVSGSASSTLDGDDSVYSQISIEGSQSMDHSSGADTPSCSSNLDGCLRPSTTSLTMSSMLDMQQHAAQLEILRRDNDEDSTNRCLPRFNPEGNVIRSPRKQSTVSLVTSALQLSYIDDQNATMEQL